MANENVGDPRIEELKKELNTLSGKLTTFESQKNELVKKRDELISKTVYESKRKIEDTYGEILTEAEKRLDSSKKEKDAERKKNINALVEKNTRSTREDNIYLNNEIKRILKDNKLPGFINSNLYFSLWSPYTIGQGFFGFLIVLIIFAIPTACCFLIFKDKLKIMFPNDIIRVIVIAFIYVAVVFVFGGIWLIIDKMTKKKPAALQQIKEIRKQIKGNTKEIERIAKETNDNTTDEQFDYTKLDREIEAGSIEVENRKNEKQEALDKFNNVTQYEISKKITDDAKLAIEELEKQIESTKAELSAKQKEYDDLKIQNLSQPQ